MEYTTLGDTGMTVSRIGLGGWSLGSSEEWMTGREKAKEIIDRAVDLGINFFDTANNYSFGESERILGSGLEGYDRDRLVVETKVQQQVDEDNPNSGGLSRKTINQELENSLERLGMEYVDVYMAHRWDYFTPIAETMRAFDTVVQNGLAHNIGASAMYTYQLANSLRVSERLNVSQFQTMQLPYNLVYREEEREMLPFCQQEGIGVTPYSPLASGFLAWPLDEFQSTVRANTDFMIGHRPYDEGGGEEINRRVEELADDKGISMAQLSLSWLLHKDWVDAPFVGVETVEHLEQAVEALDVSLSDSEIEYLEEPYVPVWPSEQLTLTDSNEVRYGLDATVERKR